MEGLRLRVPVAERRRKRRLAEILVLRMPLESVAEWLWDDFGIRVSRPDRDVLLEAILGNSSVRDRDIAAFLVSEGVEIDEEDWYGDDAR